jgi:hypothetical protein
MSMGSFGSLPCLTPSLSYVGVKVANFFPPETCAASSVVDHTHYLAFFHMGARFGRSFQESKRWIHTYLDRSG